MVTIDHHRALPKVEKSVAVPSAGALWDSKNCTIAAPTSITLNAKTATVNSWLRVSRRQRRRQTRAEPMRGRSRPAEANRGRGEEAMERTHGRDGPMIEAARRGVQREPSSGARPTAWNARAALRKQ